jgi:beta-glucanase (GH16 family)
MRAPEGLCMSRMRGTHAGLSLVAVAAALACFASPAVASARQPTIVRHEHIGRSGVYDVRIAITGSAVRNVVRVRIGTLSRVARTGRRHRRASVRVELAIRGRMLTIRATGKRSMPKLDVTLRRVRPLATPAPKTRSSTGSGGSGGPVGVAGSWHSIFDDEFAATTLDTTKWSTGWLSPGITAPVNSSELECYDPNQVTVANGELDLNLIRKTESCGGQSHPYASGMVNTNGKFSYTYGYLEARVWLSGAYAISNWPAVWTDGQSWPTDGELDVMEGLSGQACWHFHDPQGGPGNCSKATYTGGWHTFGADWEPGSVTYYYDGAAVATINSGITSSPMYVILNLAADNGNSGPLQAPAAMRVDYVRVWQH